MHCAPICVAVATVGLLTGVARTDAYAQTMRSFGTARQLHGETRLVARVDFGAGSLRLAPADDRTLYRMRVRYDEGRYAPVGRYADSHVTLGLASAGGKVLRVSTGQPVRQTADVQLSRRVELALDVTLGAVEGAIELGGMRLREVRLESGASRTTVRFSSPNRAPCERADFSAGAAELSIYGLGNSRCSTIRYAGGVGTVTLDFGGEWAADARAEVRMALGQLHLRLPKGVGVRLRMDRFLASFDPAGLVRRGDAYLSPGYAQATHHLDLDLSTTIGGVTIAWLP